MLIYFVNDKFIICFNKMPYIICLTCNGTRYIHSMAKKTCSKCYNIDNKNDTCATCKGSGKENIVVYVLCHQCHGSGKLFF